MTWDRTTTISISISLGFHLVLLLFFPGLGDIAPAIKTKWIEVDILPPEVEEPVQVDIDQSSQGATTTGENIDERPQGDSLLFPAPPVNLPSRLTVFDIEPPTSSIPLPGAVLPDVAGSGSTSTGFPDGISGSVTEMGLNPVGTPPNINWQPKEKSVLPQVALEQTDFPIEGPVSKRKVIYRPPPPKPVTNASGIVQLQFWVHPDGTVGKIVPLVRGDPELEKAAIGFLEKWRFEAATHLKTDQWGRLPLRFKLQ